MKRLMGGIPLAMIGLLAACGDDDARTDTAADTMAAPQAPAAAPAPTVSDPEILAILAASDTAEIAPSELAVERAENEQLREYARMMIRDHGLLSDSMRALAGQNSLAPQPNAMSQGMQQQLQATLASMQGLEGAAFDSAYLAWMRQSHQTALDAIDQQLLPSAQNPQLRAAIETKVRPAVQQHLQMVQGMGGS